MLLLPQPAPHPQHETLSVSLCLFSIWYVKHMREFPHQEVSILAPSSAVYFSCVTASSLPFSHAASLSLGCLSHPSHTLSYPTLFKPFSAPHFHPYLVGFLLLDHPEVLVGMLYIL